MLLVNFISFVIKINFFMNSKCSQCWSRFGLGKHQAYVFRRKVLLSFLFSVLRRRFQKLFSQKNSNNDYHSMQIINAINLVPVIMQIILIKSKKKREKKSQIKLSKITVYRIRKIKLLKKK